MADVRGEAAEAEDRIRVDDSFVAEMLAFLREDEVEQAASQASRLHAADLADLLEQLPSEERLRLIDGLSDRIDPEVLPHLDIEVREEIIDHMGPEIAGPLIAELESDDAVDVLSQLDSLSQAELLRALPRVDRARVQRGLQYPEDSAGRLMQGEFVAVPEFWTVGQVIDWLREAKDLPDDFYDLYIVDARYRPVGMVRLSNVLRSRRDVALGTLRLPDLHPVSVETDQEEVGYLFSKYGLASTPVVNERGRIVGTITFDDVVDVIQEESEEDLLKLGGVFEDDLFANPWRTCRKRFPWLLINLATAILAAAVIDYFEDSIDKLTTLAVLMPIVASLGGNAGIQTLTVVVRALASRDLTAANAFRIASKEVLVGMMNGGAFLPIGVVLTLVWFGQFELGVLFGIALLTVCIFAALAGVVLPIVIQRAKLDPAVSSGVFLTTCTDVIGFFTFLGLATFFLL
ncbi:magnesium transporter [Marinivivus vitaminiproducens]|uniref:magnesium transporter n=1 Tax=Marinivivus vitaminiproducens TaxID=3035935 RepID=UPI00279DE37A|nr:magnesium transporter [Geminicoccaceae bacterium SCSIO 64248]